MKYIRILLTVTFGIIYWPLNLIHMKVQKWYFSQKKNDIVIWYLFTPIYWILVTITFIVSIPYDFVIAKNLH